MPVIHLLRAAVLMAGLLGCAAAHAVCTLVCSCNVATTSLAFGAHNPLLAANHDSTGNVRVSCSGVAGLLIPVTVAIGAGTSGSMAARQMASGGQRLNYNIYTTSGYTTVWGDASGATSTVGGSITLNALGIGAPLDFSVYGRIFGSQASVPPGSYTDTLVVTLTYF
jgi:spore coat protein U-like protein